MDMERYGKSLVPKIGQKQGNSTYMLIAMKN